MFNQNISQILFEYVKRFTETNLMAQNKRIFTTTLILESTPKLIITIDGSFPKSKPKFEVNPPIKSIYVDQKGIVNFPYLSNWNDNSSLYLAVTQALVKLEGIKSIIDPSPIKPFVNETINKNETDEILSKMTNDLHNRNLSELISTYYDLENFSFSYYRNKIKEINNLLEKDFMTVNYINNHKNNILNYKGQIDNLNYQIKNKEKNIHELNQQYQSMKNVYDKGKIIAKLREEIKTKYDVPRDKLFELLQGKKINFEEFTKQYKVLSERMFYFNNLVDRIEKSI